MDWYKLLRVQQLVPSSKQLTLDIPAVLAAATSM
ncbi:MAG: hypothetical protein ACI95X_003184, partial [Paraglaciecola sp.]